MVALNTGYLPTRDLVHTPADVATVFAETYRRRLDDPGVTWGVPSVDKVVIPARAGEAVGLVGRPGHGKTTMLAYLGKHHCKRLMAMREQEEHNRVVVYTSWEQNIEDIETYLRPDEQYSASDYYWGRVPEDHMLRGLKGRAQIPQWSIGISGRVIEKARHEGRRVPRMTLPAVLEAIETMEHDWGVRPDLLLFDYLQLIPVDGTRGRVEQVLEAAPAIKELARRVQCPAFSAVQSSRDVDDRKWKVPQKYDCQWGSITEQAFDKLFGFWRPFATESPDAEPIEISRMVDGRVVYGSAQITPNLLIMQMTKQRGDISSYTWALQLAPQWLTLTQMERDWGHVPGKEGVADYDD